MAVRFTFAARLVVSLFLASSCLAAHAGQSTATAKPAHASHHGQGLAIAPAGLVAAIAKSQAKEAAKNPAYRIANNGCASLKTGPKGHALKGCFANSGERFANGKHTVSLHLAAWGRTGHLRPVSLHRTSPKANRIAYRAKGVSEWWRMLPMGYEQGFTVDHAPKGHGEVVLQLKTNRAPKIAQGTLAWGSLHYGKLRVIDACGKVLPSHLSAHGKTISLAFDASHAQYPVRVDPLVWLQQQKLTPANVVYSVQFGYAVALSGDGTTALVGAEYGGNNAQGAAYVYTLSGGTWTQAAELLASNGAYQDYFGQSVALSDHGATALVGAALTNGEGEAYLFVEPSGGWSSTLTENAQLTASDAASNDQFGWSVALSSDGSIALVGAQNKTVNSNASQGAAYVFAEPAAGWGSSATPSALTQSLELTASNGAAGDALGSSVALDSAGDIALVGANFADGDDGAAYVFTTTDGWTSDTQSAELTPSDAGTAGAELGCSVALDSNGTTALAGALLKNSYQGAAYVFVEPAGGWGSETETAELTASDGTSGDSFGSSVAFDGSADTALVGAPYKVTNGNPFKGAAYVFDKPAGGWTTGNETAELTASDTAGGSDFGISVALDSSGAIALVGADSAYDSAGTDTGAAYSFQAGNDLSSVISAPSSVSPGGQFDSQYIVTNNGATASGDVQVSMPLPANASFAGDSASQGSCTYATSTSLLTCDLGAIPALGKASATLTLNAGSTGGASIDQSGQLTNGTPNLWQYTYTNISGGTSGGGTTSGGTTSGGTTSGGGAGGGGAGGGGAFGLWALIGLLGLTLVGRRRARA